MKWILKLYKAKELTEKTSSLDYKQKFSSMIIPTYFGFLYMLHTNFLMLIHPVAVICFLHH